MKATTVAHLRLSGLRRTYPAWEFVRGKDKSGRECWQATLLVEVTSNMRADGVREVIQQPDYSSLLYVLRGQETRLRAYHGTHLTARPRTYAM
ncbi:hypothetical protein [Nonomuraea sp. NPDC005650]|uniref:hypothetical protein n=1 Tax=Nonomuraea sp. NPDC005650 TaxID=3157045 RepID=UPI0033A7BCA8